MFYQNDRSIVAGGHGPENTLRSGGTDSVIRSRAVNATTIDTVTEVSRINVKSG